MRILGQVMTSPGKVRDNNEDSVALLREPRTDGKEGLVVGLVADGMGGHECGEVASQLAAQMIPAAMFRHSSEIRTTMQKAFAETNAGIQQAARADVRKRGMGTTCAVVVIDEQDAWVAWVGDSRIYLLRGCSHYRLSQDHTVVGEMVRSGHLTEGEARNHRDRNVLSRALGTKPDVQVDVLKQSVRLKAGDRLLLCSDGLHDLLVDDEIAELAHEGALEDCAKKLIQLALDRGGYDNISIVLLEASETSGDARTTREVTLPC